MKCASKKADLLSCKSGKASRLSCASREARRFSCKMQLLDSSARLKNLGDDILGPSSAEMEELFRVQETIYKLIKGVPGSRVIESIRGWLSHVRRHLRTKAKVFLTSGVLRELIDAHILITECLQERDPEIRRIALSRVKPKSRLKKAFANAGFADPYLKIFEELCIEESLNGGGGSEDSDSRELQSSSNQETTPAPSPSPFGDSCYSDEDAQGHTAETASVDSGYASSGSPLDDSYHSDAEVSGFEGHAQEFHAVDSRYVSPSPRDQAIQPTDGYSLMPSTEYVDEGSAAGGMTGHQFTLPQAAYNTSLPEPNDSTAGEFSELFGPPWFPSMNDDGVAPCDTYLT